ncbi:MAG: SRPBCC family protein [Acidimicrobiales bacterium]
MTANVSVTRDIAASPVKVWTMISDLPRMGEWSPENTGGKWVRGANGPAVGARFVGSNRNGKKSWTTTCTVSECEPDRAFSFDVAVGPINVARWEYHIEPLADGGSRVTETWSDRRGWLAKKLGGPASGVNDRANHNRAGMEETLRRLADAATA